MALGINLLLGKNIPVISPGHGSRGESFANPTDLTEAFQTFEISQQNLFDLYAG